ncbi:protein phosphatase [Streptomyces sp. NPDC002104]
MKKTREKDRDGPGPRSPWDEITPGLWTGGHYWTDPAGEPRPVVGGAEFDLVISLVTRPGHGPGPRVEHLVGELPDAPLTGAHLHTALRLAAPARAALDSGRRILVRCHRGSHRSGLVVAQCLVDGGPAPAAAIDLVRLGCSPRALSNEAFTAYLAAGPDISALLVDLDPASGAA